MSKSGEARCASEQVNSAEGVKSFDCRKAVNLEVKTEAKAKLKANAKAKAREGQRRRPTRKEDKPEPLRRHRPEEKAKQNEQAKM